MPNNALWLVHVPTNKRIRLGKRMGYGWYGAPEKKSFDEFFNDCPDESQDNFALAIEDGSESPEIKYEVTYENGLTLIPNPKAK